MTGLNEVRLAALLREVDDRKHPDLQVLSVYRDRGVVPKASREDNFNKTPEDLSLYKRVRRGDLVINKMKAWSGSMALSDHDGIVSGDYMVCAVVGPVDPRYLHHLLRSKRVFSEIAARSTGIRPNQWRLYWDDLRDIRVSLPPLREQGIIADFLDAETTRFDSIIELRGAQIALVEESYRSEVERRVLGFLGFIERPSKSSPSFGVCPDAWSETALRHLGAEVQTGPFGSQLHADEYIEGGTPVINPMHLVDGRIIPSATMTITQERVADLSTHRIAVGDLLVARRGDLGRVAVVDAASAGFVCGTGCMRLRLTQPKMRGRYLSMLLGSAPLRAYFAMASVGSTMDNMSAETLLAAPVLLPPPEEQLRIENAVDFASKRREAIVAAINSQVSRLIERRQALITAAVTGHLDIPGVAA